MTVLDQVVAPAVREPSAPAPRGAARRGWSAVGLLPFVLYIALFLALPTVLAVASGFVDKAGVFTLDNVAALGDPLVLSTFANSAVLSLVTAAVGAVIGALVCWAMLGLPESGAVRTAVDAASGVLAQFGGVMLAFVLIAAIGAKGVVTVALAELTGISLYENGMWLYDLPGVAVAYLLFQVPLMIITFMPALAALKPQWMEAHLTLGGTRAGFWRQVGMPVLAPSFLASLLLLFANAFSSYATAAALASQGSQIVPLQIRSALTSETVLGRENLAGALALGMIVVVALAMTLYSLVQRRASRWRS